MNTKRTTKPKKATPAKAKKQEKKVKASSESCFMMMPFGGYFDTYYEIIYKPAIEDSGMEPARVDDLYRASNIVQDIWSFIQKSKVCVADMTTRNPNVFYELGLAHALSKPVILISETMDDVPFDLRTIRCITYDKNIPQWDTKLRENLTEAIRQTIKSPDETIPTAFLKVVKNPSEIIEISEFKKLQRDVLNLQNKDRDDVVEYYFPMSASYTSPSRIGASGGSTRYTDPISAIGGAMITGPLSTSISKSTDIKNCELVIKSAFEKYGDESKVRNELSHYTFTYLNPFDIDILIQKYKKK